MKFFKILTSVLLLSTPLMMVSCSGDSSNSDLSDVPNEAFDPIGSVNTPTVVSTTPAPSSLHKTVVRLTNNADFAFFLNRTGGSGVAGDREIGFASSFALDSTDVLISFSSGVGLVYNLPEFVTNVSYEYEKQTDNTGLLILTGNGTGDGGTSASLDGSDDDANELDIFVNDTSPNTAIDGVFQATVNIVFGSDGTSVGDISFNTSVIGTSSSFNPTLDFTTGTSLDGATITLQDGNPLPLGYSTVLSSIVESSAPTTFFSSTLSGSQDTNELSLLFNPNTIAGTTFSNVASYKLSNIVGDPSQGLSNVTDQGVATLTITTTNGTTTSGLVTYGWETNVTSTNVAVLTIINTLNGGSVTESYLMDFGSLSKGNFEQRQPTELTIRGSFDFPFLTSSIAASASDN